MSGAGINIGGINIGGEEPAQRPEKKPPAEQQKAGSTKPTEKKGAGFPRKPELARKPERSTFELITECHKLESGKTLHFAAWTDNPSSCPYAETKKFTTEGKAVTFVSLGKSHQGCVFAGGKGWHVGLGDFIAGLMRNASQLPDTKYTKKIHLFPHGGVLIKYESSDSKKVTFESSAVPGRLMDGLAEFEATGNSVLDVALDNAFRWVVITDQTVAWSNGIPADLVSRIQHYHQRKENVTRIPHLEGSSWFLQTEKSWYSANLPQSLYKCLTPQTKVHALAISPDGQWLVQYEK